MLNDLLSNAPLLALIGTIFGAVMLKYGERALLKQKAKEFNATQIPPTEKALQMQLDFFKARAEEAEEDARFQEGQVDAWKDKYYAQQEAIAEMHAQIKRIQAHRGKQLSSEEKRFNEIAERFTNERE